MARHSDCTEVAGGRARARSCRAKARSSRSMIRACSAASAISATISSTRASRNWRAASTSTPALRPDSRSRSRQCRRFLHHRDRAHHHLLHCRRAFPATCPITRSSAGWRSRSCSCCCPAMQCAVDLVNNIDHRDLRSRSAPQARFQQGHSPASAPRWSRYPRCC